MHRGQFVGVVSLLPLLHGSWGLNSGQWAWCQASLSTKPPTLQAQDFFFLNYNTYLFS